jgi:hypothetical protein
VADEPPGAIIDSTDDIVAWLNANLEDADPTGIVFATYTVDAQGRLQIAPRRTEHVACASGGPVTAAGELALASDGSVVEASNQSTGFCPEPECWEAVTSVLKRIGVKHPKAFTGAFTFRRCSACTQILIIKDSWFVCDVCDADVPRHWNFAD